MTALHRPPVGRTATSTRLKQYVLFSSLFFLPVRRRMHALNAMDSVYNLFGERTLYHNLGYWKDSPKTLDDACDAMAGLLGGAVDMGVHDQVLDVGCGFGDQDLYFLERYAPRRIVGLDVDAFKVRTAQDRILEQGLDGRIDVRVGSATSLPFGTAEFDKVTALECAFHFVTRDDFFREAYRVLRPGGALALVEPIPPPGAEQSRAMDYMTRSIMAIPKENMYPRATYADRLGAAGFHEVRVTSIYADVFPPFMTFLGNRIDDEDVVRRVNPVVRGMWRGWVRNFEQRSAQGDSGQDDSGQGDSGQPCYAAGSDYVLAVAHKPI